MLLKIRNPIDLVQEISSLSDSHDAGVTTIEVRSSQGLSNNDYIIIGKVGNEQAELRQVGSITDIDTIVISAATSFPHSVSTVLSEIAFNQIEISRKTSANGAWSVLTTVNIDVDSLETIYDDVSGQEGYFYRIRLYNATTGQFSDYSPELKGSGFSSRAVKPMIDTVLRRLRDPKGEYNTRESVFRELIYQYEDVTSRLIQSSSEFYRKELEIPMESFKYEYTLPIDFREILEVYDGGGTLVSPLTHSIARTTGIPGYELTDRNRLYFNDVPTPTSDDATPTSILTNNGFNENGTWVAGSDAENVTTDTDEFKTGTGSVNFDVDVSDSVDNKATLTNSTFTAVDLSDFEDTGRIRVWVYLPDVTYITSMNLKWGSSSTDTWDLTKTTDYKQNAFHDGWNLMEFDWGNASVTETGTPVDTAVDYIQFTINYTSSQPDDTDFRLDSIRIANTFSNNDLYRVVYTRQPDDLTNEMDELDLPPGNSSLLIDGAVAALMVGYENRDTISRELLRRSDDKKSVFNTQSAKRTRRPMGPRPYGRSRGYSRSGGRAVHRNYDVYFPSD